MRKLIYLFLLISSFTFGQDNACPGDIYGAYVNSEGEVLQINTLGEFTRTSGREILASGTVECVGGALRVYRSDGVTYDLAFFIGSTSIVITRPNSTMAWVWNRLN